MMKRLIEERLISWSDSTSRKPLLLFGARQVGKTYVLEKLGREHFTSCVHLDFAKDASLNQIFDSSLDPSRIVRTIEALRRCQIVPGETLIIFDEIQRCEAALTALKYFCEDAPEYAVAAAGSLLGVKLRERGSFPVGKVDMMALHPLSFEEYLWARGEARLSDLVQSCLADFEPCPLHEEALELYREYLLVGGMPDVVKSFVGKLDDGGAAAAYEEARTKQAEIDQAYIADIAKHAPAALVPRIIDVWQSIPGQLAKENTKFKYKEVKSGGRAALYEEPIAWLAAAAVVSRCAKVSEPVAPLKTFEESSAFKLYRADTGLLASSYEALPTDVLPGNDKGSRFRGALAESYVMQQLAAADIRPFYWGTASKAEVDFLARDRQGDIVPMEVKSGANVRSNSLASYREKYRPPYVARFSTRNFGGEGDFKSVPLYAACYFAKEFIPAPLFL